MLIYQIAVFNAAKVIIMKQYSKYFASQHGIFSFFLNKISAAEACDGYFYL